MAGVFVSPKKTRDMYPQMAPTRCPKIVFLAEVISAFGFVASRKAVGPSEGKTKGCCRTSAIAPSVESREPVKTKFVKANLILLLIG